MKKNIILSLLTWLCLAYSFSNAQTATDNFKTFDIKNSSCDVFNSVNVELSTKTYNTAFSKLKSTEKSKYPLQSQNNVDGFINDFNLTLSDAKKRYEAQEFLWKTGKEIGKYGISVLGNYAQALPTKYLTNFITPAIQQGYELYVDNEIQKGIDEHRDDIDKLIKDRIDLLYSNGIDVTKTNDQASFDAMFSLAHADIPALNRDQYGVFTRELTKRAYDYIEKNRVDIKLLNLRLNQQYEVIRQQVNTEIGKIQKGITDDANARLRELGNSITELTENQAHIYRKLDEIQDRIKINEKRISILEKEMIVVKDDIDLLKDKQREHSKLIAQNSFQIDILSGYAFQNLNTTQKINALEKGHFNNIFSTKDKERLIGELNEIKTKETIISVSSDIENYSKGVYGGLVNAGVLKGKAAQTVGKFISGVSVLTGAARIFAGDLSGFTSIISGLGSLFGKPKPSPEMEMLTLMYEEMNRRFDKIDIHLAAIEAKLDTLTSITISMYKSMALSFQYTGNQLEVINWKIDILNRKATAQLYKDYQACNTLMRTWMGRKVNFDIYSNYRTFYNQECDKCLTGLTDFTIGKDNSYFFVASNEQLKNETIIQNEIIEVYDPTKDLFRIFYAQNTEKAIYSLMFPFVLTSDASKSLYYVSRIEDLKRIDTKDVLDGYFSSEMVNEFTDFMLCFGNYFLIKGSAANFQPLALKDYLKSNQINGINQDLLEERLIKLLNIIQYSISQQSLISGHLMLEPIYSTLFNASSNEKAKDLSIKVLSNNKLLAANFATYLINKNIRLADTIVVQRLFETALINSGSLDSLNSMVVLNDIKFTIDATAKRLQLSFTRKGQVINILCPDFFTVLNNKMINSDAMYSLLDSRQKVNSKLIDLTFTKSMKNENGMESKFKYHYAPILP